MNANLKKLANFERAIAKLKEGVKRYDGSDELVRDGLIQRFEFSFELAWKALKAMFEEEGLIGLNSPKRIFREAYSSKFIDDEELWLKMLKDRNSTAHLYDENVAQRVSADIKAVYVDELEDLLQKIKQRIGQ